MNKLDFLIEYNNYKSICNGNAPEICRVGGFKYSDYQNAIQGRISDSQKLSKIIKAIRKYVSDTIVGAMAQNNINELVRLQMSQTLCA